MAYIAAGSKPQSFVKALHEAISILSLQLFKLSLKWSSTESKPDMSEEQQGSLVEEFFNIRVPSEAHFTEHLLASRLEKYKYFKVEQLISKLRQSSPEARERVKGLTPKGTPVQMSCVEEEIDRLNEFFLQLSMQLQNRAQMKREDRESSAGSSVSATPTPSLSRNGTILLELKRHYVSQRLNELQITLEHIRRCQQHGRNSKDGTRDLALTDSSSTQPGQGKHYPVHSASDGQRQDSTETSHKTDTSEGKDLGNFKYESHITELQMGNSGQTS